MEFFELPPKSDEEMVDDKEFLEQATPEMMKMRAERLLGNIDAYLDNLEALKYVVSIGEETPKEQREIRVKFKDLIDDHVNQVKDMLGTNKIKLEDGLDLLGKVKHARIKELFDRGVMNYMIDNSLN